MTITITKPIVQSTVSTITLNRSTLQGQAYNSYRGQLKIMPAFMRYFDMDSQIILLERAPDVHLLRFDNKVYELELPWMLYLVNLKNPTDFRIFFNHSQLNELDSPVYAPPLPNTASDGHFCFARPSKLNDIKTKLTIRQSMSTRIIYLLALVWDSPFNTEYFLELANLPDFVPADVKEELANITNNVDRWNTWLNWWENNIDLYTAMQWNTSNSCTIDSLIPEMQEISGDVTPSDCETIFMEFFQHFSNSVM